MHVVEGSKGGGYALGVTVSVASPDDFPREMAELESALLDWKNRRDSRRNLVVLTVVSAPEHHAAIESLLDDAYGDEAGWSPLVQGVEVQVALLNLRGKPIMEYALAQPPTDRRRKTKPWWKFWG